MTLWTTDESPLLLLLLSHFSRVRLCATPLTAAHQAPPSLGFSRQEQWRIPGTGDKRQRQEVERGQDMNTQPGGEANDPREARGAKGLPFACCYHGDRGAVTFKASASLISCSSLWAKGQDRRVQGPCSNHTVTL